MQDIHSIGTGGGGGGGGGGRLLGGVGGSNGGDRRLRPHNHNHQHGPQAMKCPRCESLNTKFCYYNNYNLSQPRHFCKSCRRYWTKGGVLRNVPVGGGCRKTKRSKSSKSNSSGGVRKSSNSQNSSSDSSTLTEKTTTNPLFNLGETVTPTPTTTTTGFVNIPNSGFDPPETNNNNNMFPEMGSTFTSLITSQIPALGFNQTEWSETEQQAFGEEELKVDQTSFTEDWNINATDQTLFDLTGSVDQSFWNDQLNYLR